MYYGVIKTNKLTTDNLHLVEVRLKAVNSGLPVIDSKYALLKKKTKLSYEADKYAPCDHVW